MAAYAALVSLMNDLELIQNHPRHSFSFENTQIQSLSQTVNFLIEFMESYDNQGFSREAAEALERRIVSATHIAQDVVESHIVDQIHAGSTLRRKPRSYFFLDLQKAIDNMNFVKRKTMQLKAKRGPKAEEITSSPPTSAEPLNSGKDIMVGFDGVALQLIEMLAGGPSSLQVIPIVGMGGIGKTTLAKNAFEHLLVQHHFDARRWATISQEFSVGCCLTELVGEKSSFTGNVHELGEQLHKKLWGRRYLIILDDMWSMEAWDELQMFFPDNGNGSRVIVTTRLSNLATNMGHSPFEMKFLDENKSWELFCRKAFGEEECSPELVSIGKKIAGKCQGLPLSIVVMGGHLRKLPRMIEHWEKVASFMNPISSSEEDENCMKIISLSYHELPSYLKPCFLYMRIFSEDEWIDALKLQRLWVAEGFLKAKKGLSLEEVAEDYLKDLVDRNLVIVRERRWNGKPVHCGMHDIVREFCLKVDKKEKFLCLFDCTEAVIRERRIAILQAKYPSDIVNDIESTQLVRSLSSPDDRLQSGHVHLQLSLKMRLLRVSEYCGIVDCGLSLAAGFQRVNLRSLVSLFYIDDHRSFRLPRSISLLWNLQTLILWTRIIAPQEIWEMAQLRHLEFVELQLPYPLSCDQQECNVMRNLHTLHGVKNFRLTEEVCKIMPNLRHLSVEYGFEECSNYIFGHLNKLETLSLSGYFNKLQILPSSLQELYLVDSHLDWEDLGMMIKSLSHLRILDIHGVRGDEWSLDDEEFPSLKSLTIWYCDDLTKWNANSSHFPVLETLCIHGHPKLEEIPFYSGDIPTLARITLDNCSVSAAVSAMRILVEEESSGDQDLRLAVKFSKMEEVERFLEVLQEDNLKGNNLHLSCGDRKIKAF